MALARFHRRAEDRAAPGAGRMDHGADLLVSALGQHRAVIWLIARWTPAFSQRYGHGPQYHMRTWRRQHRPPLGAQDLLFRFGRPSRSHQDAWRAPGEGGRPRTRATPNRDPGGETRLVATFYPAPHLVNAAGARRRSGAPSDALHGGRQGKSDRSGSPSYRGPLGAEARSTSYPPAGGVKRPVRPRPSAPRKPPRQPSRRVAPVRPAFYSSGS